MTKTPDDRFYLTAYPRGYHETVAFQRALRKAVPGLEAGITQGGCPCGESGRILRLLQPSAKSRTLTGLAVQPNAAALARTKFPQFLNN